MNVKSTTGGRVDVAEGGLLPEATSRPLAGPPFVYLIPLFDPEDTDARDFFDRNFWRLAGAAGQQILFVEIGRPGHDAIYETLRTPELASADASIAARHRAEVEATGSADFLLYREMDIAIRQFGVPDSELPCVLALTFPPHTPVKLILRREWLATPDARRRLRDSIVAWLTGALASAIAESRTSDGLTERLRIEVEELVEVIEEAQGAKEPTASEPTTHSGDALWEQIDDDKWRVTFEGKSVVLDDLRGVRYLTHLCEHSRTWIAALDLVRAVNGLTVDTAIDALGDDCIGISKVAGSDAGKQIDKKTIRECRRELARMREDQARAKRMGDAGRADELEGEIRHLERYLSHGVGMQGEPRTARDEAERARQRVSKAIHHVLKLLKNKHAGLHAHLSDRSVLEISGTLCYKPRSPRWTVLRR